MLWEAAFISGGYVKELGYIAAGYLILVGVGEYSIATSNATGVLASIGSFPSPGSALSGDISNAAMLDIVLGLGTAAASWYFL